MALDPISGAVEAATGVANTIIGAVQAGKKRRKAEALEREGKELSAKALANRKDYQVAPEVTDQYNRAQNELNAKSQIQSALEAQADTGTGNVLSAIGRNATSSAGAIAAAMGAEQQRQAGYQGAALAGAQQRENKLNRLGQATQLLAEKKDTAYDLNQQQLFEMEYNRAQDMIGAGYQGQIGARTEQANAWTEGLSAAGKVAGATNWRTGKNKPVASQGYGPVGDVSGWLPS